MMYLHDLIEALRGELRQYGEMLARFDDAEQQLSQETAKNAPAWGKTLREQEVIVARTLRRREQAQRRLACYLSLPQAAGLAEVIPLLPQQQQLLVSALIDENKALSVRVEQRAKKIRPLLWRSLQLLKSCLVTA